MVAVINNTKRFLYIIIDFYTVIYVNSCREINVMIKYFARKIFMLLKYR